MKNKPNINLTTEFIQNIFKESSLLLAAGAVGIMLGSLIVRTLETLSYTEGWLAQTGNAAILLALLAAVGAWAVKIGFQKNFFLNLIFTILIMLVIYIFFPQPAKILAITGLVFGWLIIALPPGKLFLRFVFGAGFTLAALIQAFNIYTNGYFILYLVSTMLALAILGSTIRRSEKLILSIMLFTALFIFSFENNPKPIDKISYPQLAAVAPALPASLLVDGKETISILFITERPSPLPRVWCSLPYIKKVDSIWPDTAIIPDKDLPNLNCFFGPPGKILNQLTDRYDLIYLEKLEKSSPAGRKHLIQEAWQKLNPHTGVLILPSIHQADLPLRAKQILPLPGSQGTMLAVSPNITLSAEPEKLDQRLGKLLKGFGQDTAFMPNGIYAALYTDTDFTISNAKADTPKEKKTTDSFRFGAIAAIIIYLFLRLIFSRQDRGNFTFTLVENGAGFALLLLAAESALAEIELTTGVTAAAVWAMPGILVLPPFLRPRIEKALVLISLLLPLLWRWHGGLGSSEFLWLVILLITALAAGIVQNQTITQSGFTPRNAAILGLLGFAIGGIIYKVITVCLPEPLITILLAAILLRGIRFIK